MKSSDYWSSFEDEMVAWEEVYNLSDMDLFDKIFAKMFAKIRNLSYLCNVKGETE